RAQGYKGLEDMGLTQKQIAQKVGLESENSVYRYLALLDLPPEVQETLPRGRVTEMHTRFIRQISDKAKQIEVAKQVDQEGWSVKETEKRVNELLGKPGKAKQGGSGGFHKPKEPPVDPLAEVWKEVNADPAIVSTGVYQAFYHVDKMEGQI